MVSVGDALPELVGDWQPASDRPFPASPFDRLRWALEQVLVDQLRRAPGGGLALLLLNGEGRLAIAAVAGEAGELSALAESQAHEGPGHAAFAGDEVVRWDTPDTRRWPRFCDLLYQVSPGTGLACPVRLHEAPIGALVGWAPGADLVGWAPGADLVGWAPGADPVGWAPGADPVGWAPGADPVGWLRSLVGALENELGVARRGDEVEGSLAAVLSEALAVRGLLDAATSMLAQERGWTGARAALRLQQWGSELGLAPVELAQEIVDAGSSPSISQLAALAAQERRRRDGWARLALHDPLTGLANRRLFEDRLGQALARSLRSSAGPNLLYIDLDDFKRVNDEAGHGAGDVVLQWVAARLGQAVRPGDTVARLGGDEFAVLCEGPVEGAEARRIAARIDEQFDEPVMLPAALCADGRPGSVRVSASIGIALCAPGATVQEALRDADRAMYRVKRPRARTRS